MEFRALIFEEFLEEKPAFLEIFGVVKDFFGKVTKENFAAFLKYVNGELVTILGLGSFLSHRESSRHSCGGKFGRGSISTNWSQAVDPSEWDMVHEPDQEMPCFSKTTSIVSRDHQGCGETTRRIR